MRSSPSNSAISASNVEWPPLTASFSLAESTKEVIKKGEEEFKKQREEMEEELRKGREELTDYRRLLQIRITHAQSANGG